MSSVSSLPIVLSNIQVMYGAVCRTDTEELQLSSSDGKYLSQKDSAIQLIKRLIYSDSVQQALVYTAMQFQQLQEEWVKPQLTAYEKYLSALKLGSKEGVDEPLQARDNIREWFHGTETFFVLFSPDKMPSKLTRLLDQFFPGQQPFQDVHGIRVRRYMAIIDMESMSRNPPPLNDWFLKCTYNEDLTDRSPHKRWIEGFIQNGGAQATAYRLYEGVKGATEFFQSQENKTDVRFDPVPILYSLWNNKPKNALNDFLTQPDSEQLEWRKKIQVNSQIGKFRVTGRYLGSLRVKGRSVFMLDDPNLVVSIFADRLLVLLYDYSTRKFPPEIPLPKVVYVDPEGRYLIQERLDDPAHSLDRKNVKEIGKVEKAALRSAVNIMRYCLENKWCPDIPLSFFRMDTQNNIRSLRPYQEVPLWLEPLEDYAKEVSQGNVVVYKYLMQVVNFHDNFRYNLYSGLLQKYAVGIEAECTSGILFQQVDDFHVDAWKVRMHEFFLEMQKIRENIKKRFHDKYGLLYEDHDFIRAAIAHYHEYDCISKFFPNSEDEIFNKLVLIHEGDETIGRNLKGPPMNLVTQVMTWLRLI